MATVAVSSDLNTITGEIFIAAPPARVFEAITDPEQMPKWWGQEGLHRLTSWKGDLRTGGKWSSTGQHADGKPYKIEGEFIKVDPPRLLVMTWIPDWVGPVNTVLRWELEAHIVHGLHPSGPRKAGTGTLVRIRHEGFATSSEALARHTKGWPLVLGWLQGFLENGDTVESRREARSA